MKEFLICQLRLKRVVNRFEQDQTLFKSDKSLGFKYFTLSNSNFKIWDSTLEKEPEAIQAKLFSTYSTTSPEAEQEAILYELLLKSGFELTTPIEKLTLAGLGSRCEGQLLICLEKRTHPRLLKSYGRNATYKGYLLR